MSKKRKTLFEVLKDAHRSLHFIGVPRIGFNVHSRTPDDDTPLHIMAMRGDRYAVEMLLSAGADVNAIGDMGYTPLGLAVTYRKTLVIELLLAAGADTELVNEFGFSPRARAEKDACPEIVALFRQHNKK